MVYQNNLYLEMQIKLIEQNLTSGKIGKSLIVFSLPMILGKIIGASALSAVGSSYTLIVHSIILGLCMGSGVVLPTFMGQKNGTI